VAGSRDDARLMVMSAGGMYAGAAFVGLIEGFVPGTPRFPITSGVIALALTGPVLLFGRHVPRVLLSALGPIGVGLIAYALANTRGYGDGAALYAWPVLWTAHFFRRQATAIVIAAIAVAHALALRSMPPGIGYASRWIDVMVSMTIVAVVVRALTENKERLLLSLANEARVDPLTGLLNRRGLDERAAVELARAQRDQLCVSVVAFDIDHFKRINDRHGHETGDQVLERIGEMLREQVRGSDIVARVGGEEFLMLLSGCDAQQAIATAERVRLRATSIAVPGLPSLTLSAGVAATIQHADLASLTARADRALYQAKREGRNRTVITSDQRCIESSPMD
jgi:diguanylate cyclase (GGDEF)-like protein